MIFCQAKIFLSTHVTTIAIWKFQKNETFRCYCVTWVWYFFFKWKSKNQMEPLVFEKHHLEKIFSHVTPKKSNFVKNQPCKFTKKCTFFKHRKSISTFLFHIRIAQVMSFLLMGHFIKIRLANDVKSGFEFVKFSIWLMIQCINWLY